jgi:homoserine dehydrogenase
MADISRILADQNINIEAIIQKEPASGSHKLPIVLLTKRIVEGAMDEAIAKIEQLDAVEGSVVRIRVENLG